MNRRRHALALAVTVAVAALALPTSAAAHAYLLRTDPEDGSRLASSPRQIHLWFSEDVSAKLSRVKLSGARTGTVSGAAVTGSGTNLVVSLPKLARDTYSLDWLTVSADDLHLARGVVVFAYGTAEVLPPKAKPRPSPVASGPDGGEVVLRWLDFGAIAGLIGALALLGVCIPQAARRGATGLDRARRRLAGAATASAAAALVTGAGLLLVQVTGLSTESTAAALGTILLRTSYGPIWIARELLLGVLLAAALVLRRRRQRVPVVALAALASVALCVAVASNSHAAALRGHVSVATAVLALHLLAAAVWAGGVFALVLVLLGRWRAGNGPSARLLLRSFGGLAALCVAVVAITGLYSAGVDVASPDALILTFYGRTLLLKTLFFVVVGLIGLTNSLLVRTGRDGSRWFGRGVRLEVALATGVILLAALLTASAPARGPRFLPAVTAAQAPAADVIGSARAGDLLVTLSVKPNQPGVNFVTAGVFNTRRPAPAPIRTVDVSVGSTWLRATRVRDQYWQIAGNELDRPGKWSIGLRVHRAGLPDEMARVPWTLPRFQPQAPVTRTVLSRRPLSPLLSTAAAIGALVLGAVLLVLALRRRPRRIPLGPRERPTVRA